MFVIAIVFFINLRIGWGMDFDTTVGEFMDAMDPEPSSDYHKLISKLGIINFSYVICQTLFKWWGQPNKSLPSMRA